MLCWCMCSDGRTGHAGQQCSDQCHEQDGQFPGPALGDLAGHCLWCGGAPAAVLPAEAQAPLLALVAHPLQAVLVRTPLLLTCGTVPGCFHPKHVFLATPLHA